MSEADLEYDEVGKLDLHDVYNRPTPVGYFSTLSQLDYRVAEEVRPVLRRLIEARRELKPTDDITILDVGCSYGVNAALLKFDLALEDLNAHYADNSSRAELLRADAALFRQPSDEKLTVVGIDTADQAVRYAVEAGLLDAGLAADFENRTPNAAEAAKMAGADLVISTGCYGYVTETTLGRILDASEGEPPWMAHTVLRMFDYGPAEALLASRGYVTEKVDGLLPQRRFASREEQRNAIRQLESAGIDPSGLEADGWYFAELYLSVPEDAADVINTGDLMPPRPAVLAADGRPAAAGEPGRR